VRFRAPQTIKTQPFGSGSERTSPAIMRRVFLPAALLLLYVGQCVWFVGTQSFTVDEPTHIRAGIEAVRNGRIILDENPPLARLLYGLVLRDPKWQIRVTQIPGAAIVNAVQPSPEAMAWRARLVNVALGVVLGILLWFAARRFFSEAAANVALAVFAFSSEVIAHFSLATTDGAGTLFVFTSVFQLAMWWRNPSWKNTVLLGGLMGALLLAKLYTAPLFVLTVALLFFGPPTQHKPAKIVTSLVISFFTIWAGYQFHVSELRIHQGTMVVTFPNREPELHNYSKHPNLDLDLYVPAGEYLEGLRDQVFRNRHGQPAFFLGQVSHRGGWKLYFPVAMMLKWPTTVLVLGFLTGLLLLRGKIRVPHEFAWMALFPALFFGFAIFSTIDVGVRLVLAIYPFLLLFCAAIWQVVQSNRISRWVLYAALVLNAADCLRYAPGYLSYFTPFVRPSNTYRLLADSNLDWGQGLLAVRKYQSQHPQEEIYLTCFGCLDPALYDIRSRPLGERQRVSGTAIVSASQLAGPVLNDPNAFHWLFQYPSVTILDHSMYVFRVPSTSSRR